VEIIAFLPFKVDVCPTAAILTARKAATVIALGRLQAPAGGRCQARHSGQHAFQVPAGACATERASGDMGDAGDTTWARLVKYFGGGRRGAAKPSSISSTPAMPVIVNCCCGELGDVFV